MTDTNTPAAWDLIWTKTGYKIPEQKPVDQRKMTVARFLPCDSTVLDIASGASQIAKYLHPSVRYIGLDFSGAALRLSPAPGIQADVRELPIKPKSVDVVIAMEILEHLQNEYLFIGSLVTIARHMVIITVPNNRLGPPSNPYHLRTYDRFSLYDRIHASVIVQDILITTTENNLIARIQL